MIRAALVAALLVPGLAWGQGLIPSQPLRLFQEDAGTVTHLVWNGSALRDVRGLGWQMQGTVPQVKKGSIAPFRPGAGPYSGSNYYYLASTNPLQFAGDFTVCVAFTATSTAAYFAPVSNWAANKGWEITGSSPNGNIAVLLGTGAGNATIETANRVSTTGVNVACIWATGGRGYVKLNGGSTVSVAGTSSPANTTIVRVGDRASGTIPLPGVVYEVWASTTTATEANITALQSRAMSLIKLRPGF